MKDMSITTSYTWLGGELVPSVTKLVTLTKSRGTLDIELSVSIPLQYLVLNCIDRHSALGRWTENTHFLLLTRKTK